MAPYPVILPLTGAIATPVQFNANECDMVCFAVTGTLATTETITINVMTTTGFQPYFNTAGTVVALTATVPSVTVPGGWLYGLTKLSSASAAGADALLKPRSGVQ